MKQTVVGIYEAKAHFSKYVRRVAAGREEVVITSAGAPLVKMVSYSPRLEPRSPGMLKGKLLIADDFDELTPDFGETFG